MGKFLVPRFLYEFLVQETWTVSHQLYIRYSYSAEAITIVMRTIIMINAQTKQKTKHFLKSWRQEHIS